MVFREITQKELDEIISVKRFDYDLLVKDYYITVLLYLMKDVIGIYFKGGTALQKTILDYARISEDIDFTLNRDLSEVKKDVIKVIDNSKMFGKITKDKDVSGFTRLIVPYITSYGESSIFIDLNERLNISKDADLSKIKEAYRNLAMQWHPDKNENKELSKLEFIAISEAYEVISNNTKRNEYDISGKFTSFRTEYEQTESDDKQNAKDIIFEHAWSMFQDLFKDSTYGSILKLFPEMKYMAKTFFGDEFYNLFKDKYLK